MNVVRRMNKFRVGACTMTNFQVTFNRLSFFLDTDCGLGSCSASAKFIVSKSTVRAVMELLMGGHDVLDVRKVGDRHQNSPVPSLRGCPMPIVVYGSASHQPKVISLGW